MLCTATIKLKYFMFGKISENEKINMNDLTHMDINKAREQAMSNERKQTFRLLQQKLG